MYKNKGSGIIVGNIFKPLKSIASSVCKYEKKKRITKQTPTITKQYNPVKQEESTDMILNRLISGSGLKIKTKKV